jgi:hypothetical protein
MVKKIIVIVLIMVLTGIKHCPFCGRVPVPVDGGEGVDNVLKIVKQVYHPRIKGIECPLNILIFKLKAWNQRAL